MKMENFLKNFLILINFIAFTWAIPTQQNYTVELLRLAKGSEMKTYLNEEKPPCQNFYKFACGQWSRLHPAPAHGKNSHLDQLTTLYEHKSAEMLNAEGRGDSGIDHKLKDFYISCRESGKLDKVGLDHIIGEVNLIGGWPNIKDEKWYESEYDWLKVIAEVRRKMGIDILIGLQIVPDLMEQDMNRIMVGAPKMHFDREVYLQEGEDKEKLRQAYTFSIESQLHRYFPDMSEQWASEVAKQVLFVEKRMAEGLPHNNTSVDKYTRLRYTADLKAAYGSFVDINRYLNLIFNQTIYAQIYESPEDYFFTLMDVIKSTPKLTIANYTMWRVLDQFDLAHGMLTKSSSFCVNQIMEFFPDALENMFARNYHTMHIINEIRSVWTDIKKTFREELKDSPRLTWISVDTKQRLGDKLESMDVEISKPESRNGEQMHKLFIRKSSYYQNLIAIWQWRTGLNLGLLFEKPVEPPFQNNLPHYVYESNKIQVPAVFLQSRFLWDPAYPHALLYSTLGYLLAQQMLKGFDSHGLNYDHHGGFQKLWWDSSSEQGFHNRSKCFVDQYKQYKYPNWIQSEEKKLSDTYVTDNGALTVAYQAYQQWWKNVANSELAEHESLPLLPNYPQNQLFFLGFAQMWCAAYADDIKEYTDIPEHWRVIGALANMNEFAKEFQCEIGNKMNPTQKCFLY